MSDAAAPLSNGRYRLLSELGRGGMAVVYLGWDEQLAVHRAIKVLLPDLGRRKKIRERFMNEARTMARLQHPNIVPVQDVGVYANRPYMVMSLVRGGCLIDRVNNHGPLQPHQAVTAIGGMLQGLHAAHMKGVVHRDVKPHNVLITTRGVAQVTDFGIARAEEDSNLTKTGAVMGTWAYMAPEQRMGAKGVDARADVYAAAASLYNVLTTRQPVDLYAVEAEDELYAGIPAPLTEVIRRGSAYKREKRYESADEMRQALLAAVEALPADDPDEPPLAMPARPLEQPPPAEPQPPPGPPNDTFVDVPTEQIRVAPPQPPAESHGQGRQVPPPPTANRPARPPANTSKTVAPSPPPEPKPNPRPAVKQAASRPPPVPPLPDVPIDEPVTVGSRAYSVVPGGVREQKGIISLVTEAPRVTYLRLHGSHAFLATNQGATDNGGVKGSIDLRPEICEDTAAALRMRTRRGGGWFSKAPDTVLMYELGGKAEMAYRTLLATLYAMGVSAKAKPPASIHCNVVAPKVGNAWFYPHAILYQHNGAIETLAYNNTTVEVEQEQPKGVDLWQVASGEHSGVEGKQSTARVRITGGSLDLVIDTPEAGHAKALPGIVKRQIAVL